MYEKKLVNDLTWLISYFSSHYEEAVPKNKRAMIRTKLESLKQYILENVKDGSLQMVLNNRMVCLLEVFSGKYCSDEEVSKNMIMHLSYCLTFITDPYTSIVSNGFRI